MSPIPLRNAPFLGGILTTFWHMVWFSQLRIQRLNLWSAVDISATWHVGEMSTECQDSGAMSVSLWKHGLVTSLSATVLVPSSKNRPVRLSRAGPQRDRAQSSSVLSTFNFGRLAYIWRVISLMQLASHRMAGVISSWWQQCKYSCILLANAWQAVTYWCQKLEVGPHEDLRSEVETSLKTSIWLFSYSN